MAAVIVPKSKIRQIQNISVGYGEVPVTEDEEGRTGWGLPGRGITFCPKAARKLAARLDTMIRRNLCNPNRPTLL